jgi:putative tryptophan/tyrosine transport system substrate-binding protein
MTFEALSAEGRPERLPQLAREASRARPDVLIAGFGTLTAQAAKAATTTIPIVFTLLGDPVGAGLVTSLGRPGGNITGLSGVIEIGGKQLQLLRELIPGKQVIAVLMNPDTPFTRLALKEITAAAETSRTRVQVLEARTADQVPRQLEAAVTAGAAGLIVLGDPLIYSVRRQISDLAAKALPSRDVSGQGLRRGGGIDILRLQPTAGLPASGRIRGPDPEGRQAGRPAHRAADEVRANHQPEGRQGAWHHDPSSGAGAGR